MEGLNLKLALKMEEGAMSLGFSVYNRKDKEIGSLLEPPEEIQLC